MLRIIEDFCCCSSLTETPTVHNNNVVTHIGDNTEIVRHQDNCHSKFLLQILNQLQNLCLNGHIQCCCRLICNEDIRFASQCHGNHDSLAHASGMLMWILLHAALRFIDADEFQQLDCSCFCFLSFPVCVKLNRLPQLVANGKHRIERRHWILENDRAAFSAEVTHLCFRPCCKILTFIENVAFGDFTGLCKNLHDGICHD